MGAAASRPEVVGSTRAAPVSGAGNAIVILIASAGMGRVAAAGGSFAGSPPAIASASSAANAGPSASSAPNRPGAALSGSATGMAGAGAIVIMQDPSQVPGQVVRHAGMAVRRGRIVVAPGRPPRQGLPATRQG